MHSGCYTSAMGLYIYAEVVFSGDDCVARLWDARQGEFRGLLDGHRTAIRWAAFSSDGCRLATVSPDRMVKIWDVEGAHCLQTLPGELAFVWQILSLCRSRCAVLYVCHHQLDIMESLDRNCHADVASYCYCVGRSYLLLMEPGI